MGQVARGTREEELGKAGEEGRVGEGGRKGMGREVEREGKEKN